MLKKVFLHKMLKFVAEGFNGTGSNVYLHDILTTMQHKMYCKIY